MTPPPPPPPPALTPKLRKRWLELDLTGEAESGELPRAWEQDALSERLSALLDQGQSLILTGKAGVGKTALVRELVARAREGLGPQSLVGKRVLQLSFQRCLSTLAGPEDLGASFRALTKALEESAGVVPFFCDLDLLFHHDLEVQLESFCGSYANPVLGEGSVGITRAILEYFPGLKRTFRPILLEEPSPERTRRILAGWAEGDPDLSFSEGALDEALYLSQRFLSRQRQPRKALELLVQTARGCGVKPRVERGDVIDRFCQDHGTPRWLLDPSERPDLSQTLGERSIGRTRQAARWSPRLES